MKENPWDSTQSTRMEPRIGTHRRRQMVSTRDVEAAAFFIAIVVVIFACAATSVKSNATAARIANTTGPMMTSTIDLVSSF